MLASPSNPMLWCIPATKDPSAQGRADPSRSALKNQGSVELATLEWVPWFNHHRLLEPIGYIPQLKLGKPRLVE